MLGIASIVRRASFAAIVSIVKNAARCLTIPNGVKSAMSALIAVIRSRQNANVTWIQMRYARIASNARNAIPAGIVKLATDTEMKMSINAELAIVARDAAIAITALIVEKTIPDLILRVRVGARSAIVARDAAIARKIAILILSIDRLNSFLPY